MSLNSSPTNSPNISGNTHAMGSSDPKTVFISVPGIRCAACIAKVESQLEAVEGVSRAQVNLSRKRVEVTTASLPVEYLINRLAAVGIEAHALNASMTSASKDYEAQKLLIRLAVAGFAMMNVMLLSVANWSGASGTIRELFHLISGTIALPAALYSAQPFFKNALAGVKTWSLNMDVPISLAILLASVLSLYEMLNSGEKIYFDAALSLTFFLLLGRYLDYMTRKRARSATEDLSALEVHSADRISNGRVERVATKNLKINDVVQVSSGMQFPVDGYLQKGSTLIDRSMLTGETMPILISKGARVHAGEINVGALAQVSVCAVGRDTTMQRLSELISNAENPSNKYTNLADRAARIYAPAVHILATTAFVVWLWISGDARLALNIAIAVLIITCPCALGLAVPAVSIAAIGKLFSKGFLVKDGDALERLAEIDTCLFDKTGTLTLASFQMATNHLSETEKSIALALAQGSHHPLSKGLAAALYNIEPAEVVEIEEIIGSGMKARYHGEVVKLGSTTWLGANHKGLGLKVGNQAPRNIPTREVLRPGIQKMIIDMKKLGISLCILSGDHAENVKNMGEKLGITTLIPNVNAEEKHTYVSSLTAEGHKVLMVGDGLNDTAALATAHASIAPASALDASRNVADIVVLSQDFSNLASVIITAKTAIRLSKQNFLIAACYNIIAVPLALLGMATPLIAAIAMSASSLTVLMNAFRLKSIK